MIKGGPMGNTHTYGAGKGKEKQQQEVKTREMRGIKAEVCEFAGEPERGESVFSVSRAHRQMLEGHKVE